MEKSNNTTTAGYKYLIRLHNLPRNSSLSHILRFLWEAVNFNADEACIRAYSSKNAIVGFTKKNLADESVSYCNGRVLYGRLISVHEASDEDLQRVLAESREAGPELGPKRLGPARGVSTEEEDNGTSQGYDYEDISTLETGLNSYSDSDSDMDLAIPDFHKNPPPPDMDTTASRHRHSSGSTGLNEQMSTSSSAATTDEHSPQQEDNVVEVESAVKTTNLKRKAGAEVLAEAGNEADGKRPKKLARTQKQDSTEYRSPLLNIPLPPEKRPRLDQPATSAAVAAVTPASPLQLPPSTFRPPAPGDPRWPSVQVQQQQTNSYIPVPLRHPFRSPLPAGAAGTTNAILTPPLGQLNATGLAAKITLKPGNANLTPLGQPYASRFPAKIPPKPGNANLTPLGQFSGPRLPPNFGQQRDFPPPIIADKQNPPVSFELTLVISSQHCLLKWKLPEELPVDNQRVEIMGGDRQNVVQALGREKQFLQKVTAGVQYQASVQSFDIKGRQLALAFKRFRAIYSRNEMEMLRNLAEQFCVPEFYPFDQLHRAKPRAYFDAIYEHPNGRRLMMPYKKDENGHPGSPINGAIDGFFFSTLLSGDSLPTQSPFGDVQMVMDAHKMLNIGAHNFYFADFYCNEAKANVNGISSSLHYVTIVVCRKNSRTDKYCADRLIRLDPTNNKFLRVREERSGLTYLTNNARGLLVEIYYTEPISLFDARKFLEVTPMGKGSSRPEGLPNNKQCRTCNFLV